LKSVLNGTAGESLRYKHLIRIITQAGTWYFSWLCKTHKRT